MPDARVLIIANHTLGSGTVRWQVARRLDRSIFLLVPTGSAEWGATEERLATAIEEFRGMGADVSGAVESPDVLGAVLDLLSEVHFDEIVVSTFTPEFSAWV